MSRRFNPSVVSLGKSNLNFLVVISSGRATLTICQFSVNSILKMPRTFQEKELLMSRADTFTDERSVGKVGNTRLLLLMPNPAMTHVTDLKSIVRDDFGFQQN